MGYKEGERRCVTSMFVRLTAICYGHIASHTPRPTFEGDSPREIRTSADVINQGIGRRL